MAATAGRRARWFACVLMLSPLPVLAIAFWIAGTNWFLQNAMPAYMRGLNSEYQIHGRHCDVLVFGDSTALTGIQPRIVSAEMGEQVCSIARTKGETGVTGFDFLERYLRYNPPPRLLVLAFAPEDWRPMVWNDVAYVEGISQLVRHAPTAHLAHELVLHPEQTFGYATFVYRESLFAVLRHGKRGPEPVLDDGHMTMLFPQQTACIDVPKPNYTPQYRAPSADYIAALRRRFTTAQTRVVIAVSPEPACDLERDRYIAALTPLADLTFPAFPVTDYNELDRHFTPQGSALYSQELAQKLMQLQAQPTEPARP